LAVAIAAFKSAGGVPVITALIAASLVSILVFRAAFFNLPTEVPPVAHGSKIVLAASALVLSV